MRNYITTYDPFFDRFFLRANNCSTQHMMKTDIKENKNDYQLFIELPEVKKEDTRITPNIIPWSPAPTSSGLV